MRMQKALAGLTLYSAFAGSAFSANEIVKLKLTAAQEMCAEVGCLTVGPGEVGIYNNAFLNHPLAFATATSAANLGGVPVPAGSLIKFEAPDNRDYYGTQFSLTFATSQNVAGIDLMAHTPIGFNRFRQVWNPTVGKHLWEVRPNDEVRVNATLDRNQIIEGVELAAGKPVGLETTLDNLIGGKTDRAQLLRGTVAARSLLRATQPIELLPGDFLTLTKTGVHFTVYPGPRVITPGGYQVRSAGFERASGRLVGMDLTHPTTIQGITLTGAVGFYPNGKISEGTPAHGVEQTINGVTLNGKMSYYGDLEFHDTGNARTIISTHVAKNAALLPKDLVAQLPAMLDSSHSDRIQFFFNPNGVVRLVTVEMSKFPGEKYWSRRLYVASGDNAALTFRLVDKTFPLFNKIMDSTRGYIQPEVVEYLKTH